MDGQQTDHNRNLKGVAVVDASNKTKSVLQAGYNFFKRFTNNVESHAQPRAPPSRPTTSARPTTTTAGPSPSEAADNNAGGRARLDRELDRLNAKIVSAHFQSYASGMRKKRHSLLICFNGKKWALQSSPLP